MEQKIDLEDEVQRGIEFGTLAEQKDEAFYDDRSDADDDLEKGRIKFPTDKLYGRDAELKELHDMFKSFDSNGACNALFLAGYSGTGKSALVDEFIKEVSKKGGSGANFIGGKFGQMKAGDPFSAIAQALNNYVLHLTKTSSEKDLQPLKKSLGKADIFVGSDNAAVLSATLVPALNGLLKKAFAKTDDDFGAKGVGQDLNAIKFNFQNFIKALAADRPLVLFIDDLQWADDASLQLIDGLLKDKSVNQVLFIGAYRPNEVDEEHAFAKVMKEVEESKGSELVRRMEIFNLSPDSITQFISDSLDRTPEEVGSISEAIYTKTLGNIFFVREALEELVRKNAIYYDVICFQWQFGDVTRVEMEQFLSDDVVEMVRSKLMTLPDQLQKALAVAAYTNNKIELDLLASLLTAESIEMDLKSINKMMNRAFLEGLVLKGGAAPPSNRSFKFAHDRIREAACASVPAGDERDQLLLRISMVLMKRGSPEKDDWMLYAAARHLNSIPLAMTNDIQAADLNLKVGNMAVSKGAFNEGVVFLRAGVQRLDPATCWTKHYELSLGLKNGLMEAEHFLGNKEKAMAMADEIFKHAKTVPEKSKAHFVHIDATSKGGSDWSESVDTALEILKLYKIDLPSAPKEGQLKREKLRVKMALRGGSLLKLAKLPIATDEFLTAQMKVAVLAITNANFAKRTTLALVLGNRMLREAISNKAITKDVPYVLVMLGGPMRQQEKYDEAFSYANAGITLMERFPGETALEFVKAKMALYAMLSCLRMAFRDAVDTYLDLNKVLLSKGENDMGLGAGMIGMYAFLNSSFPLNALFEPKLLLLEETATNLGRSVFVVNFSLLRQCLYNLQGGKKAAANPADVTGFAFNEAEVMAASEGPAQMMNNRDIAIVRLMLAVYFGDEATMEQMLDRLDQYPVYDMPLARQHLRMSFVGFAAHIMAARSKKHAKWAKTSMDFYEKLARFGSPNALPVFSGLKALSKPTVAAFDEAIQVCGNAGLLNLTALFNEQCGLFLLESKSDRQYESYLKHALWFYHDWGATGKVEQLKKRFDFLKYAMQEKPPSQLTSVRQQAAMLGVSGPPSLSDLQN